jgi:cell pole-organizing protein PopZ
MSASSKPEPQPPGDPSMEDILASIRRILSEEEQPAGAKPVEGEPVLTEPPDDVLVLEPSMLIAEPRATATVPAGPAVPEPVSDIITVEPSGTDTVIAATDPPDGADLVAPETARAAAASVSELVATLTGERSTRVYGGGPTIEDLVRAELRPVLKEWLDTHLPSLVERLVRAEIERVVGRIAQ